MLSQFWTLLISLLFAAPVVFAAFRQHRRIDLRYLALEFGSLALSGVLLGAGVRLQNALMPGLSWNWGGKLLSLAVFVSLLCFTPSLRAASGVNGIRSRRTLSILLTTLLCVAGVFASMGDAPKPFNAETLLFQATMPGPEEELVFRGVAMVLLDRALGRMTTIRGVVIGWGAAVTTVVFAALHAVHFDNAGLHVSFIAFAVIAVTAVLFVWLRLLSGSLLPPIVFHASIDVSQFCVPMLGI